jgi:hypothetical protein
MGKTSGEPTFGSWRCSVSRATHLMQLAQDVGSIRTIARTIGPLIFLCAASAFGQEYQPDTSDAVPAEERAPTPGEAPAARPPSELDTTVTPPPVSEQATDRTDEVGPSLPPEEDEQTALEACKEIQPQEDTVLYRVRRTFAVTACASSAWLDGLFGDQFHYDEYRDTRGSVSVGTLWSEYDGFDPRVRARVRLRLPQWNERVSAFAGRVGEDEYISDTEGEFEALPTRIFEGGFDDEAVLVGLGYSPLERTGNDFDAGIGVRVDLPLDPYVRARYEIIRTFAEHYVFRARETIFWQNSEGFGSTTRFNIDRALSDRFLLRWNNIGRWTEETIGFEWFSEVTLFQKLTDRMGIAWQNYVSGATDNEVDLTRYGTRAIWRRQLNPEWLFLELRIGERRRRYCIRNAVLRSAVIAT